MSEPIVLRIPRGGRRIQFDRPRVMGILNLNDDSFSGDGTLDHSLATDKVRSMLADGADMIDVGAESARTNRPAIPVDEEIRRLQPFLAGFAALVASAEPLDSQQLWPPLLSINTWRPEVVEAVLPGTGDILNDMGGLPDDRNARACARAGAALLLMHTVGEPKIAQTDRTWPDVFASLEGYFAEKLALAEASGVDRRAILIDPGIDFAKQRDDNLRIYARADQLAGFGRPVLMPISRKTVIGDVLGLPDPRDRDAGTIACMVACMMRLPATVFRVHNVAAAARAARVVHAVI